MNIFVTGSTGFIGRFAVALLQDNGHEITVLVRDIDRGKKLLGQNVRILGPNLMDTQLIQALEKSDAVINLSGSPLATRWTNKKKEELKRSRIGVTQRLVKCLKSCKTPPKVFVSASAVGFYGNSGDAELTEESHKGKGFLSDLCEEWEGEAIKAESKGVRVCRLRMGIALGREGGVLKAMALPFKMNLGGYFGGKQFVPWIHIRDLVRIVEKCISDDTLNGAINCTAPLPVRNKEFALLLQKATRSRFLLRIPAIFLKPILGDAIAILTDGQNVIPSKLLASGFEFYFPALQEAMMTEFTQE